MYDQGASDGLVYLAMEYVAGRTVRDVLREHGRLTPEQALTILDPVLQALVAAHRAGFVHRDIKPENVLLGDDGSVKVADFGLARAISTSNSTATQGVLIGTVAYLSPEQVQRGVADARSDVYGCGILLYEMLTGAVPYAGETPLAVAYQHVHEAVPRPSSIVAGLPQQVDDLVGRATRHDPDERWHDADELLDAVRVARRELPTPRPLTVDLSDGARTLVVALPTGEVAPAQRPATKAKNGKPAKPPKPPRGGRRRSGGWIVLLVIVLVAALIGALGWWYGSARSVAVPSVVGKSLAAAQAAFAGSGLTLQAGEPAYSETVKKDLVITTDPEPGGEARTGSIVHATLSLGPERYPVPDVQGQAPGDARSMIADGGLAVAKSVQQKYDETVESGRVIGTDPAVGARLRKGTPVTLVVSKGPQPIPVPKVVGWTFEKAKAEITGAGLVVAPPVELYDTRQPAGRVISVSPAPGRKLAKGDTVKLVVSKGPPPVLVPNLFARSATAASQALTDLGLKAKISYPKGAHPFNLVYSQSVNGSTVPKGSTVELYVF